MDGLGHILVKTKFLPILLHIRKVARDYMSCVMRKPDFCLGENKGADQLRSNCEADQHLCFLPHG